jgi:excinuclease ABC subunit C
LEGGKSLEKLIKEMEKEMEYHSKNMNFEKAIELRDSIKVLSSLLEKQKLESYNNKNEDYIYFAKKQDKIICHTFKKINGVIQDTKRFYFDLPVSGEFLSEFLPRFYDAGGIPRKIFVNSEPSDKSALEKFLSSRRGRPVSILVPKKGKNKEILDLLKKNVEIEINKGANPALIELQKILNLPSIPNVIECFDISNLSSSTIVGSMVQFVNGSPNKSNYRRFKIKTVEMQDDFASIREIVFRRYYRLKKENAKFPDMILIDGGKGQLNAALSALEKLELSIPCFALAKENEEIYTKNKESPIVLPKTSKALKVLQFARDEAHRFSVSYQRLVRRKLLVEEIKQKN